MRRRLYSSGSDDSIEYWIQHENFVCAFRLLPSLPPSLPLLFLPLPLLLLSLFFALSFPMLCYLFTGFVLLSRTGLPLRIKEVGHASDGSDAEEAARHSAINRQWTAAGPATHQRASRTRAARQAGHGTHAPHQGPAAAAAAAVRGPHPVAADAAAVENWGSPFDADRSFDDGYEAGGENDFLVDDDWLAAQKRLVVCALWHASMYRNVLFLQDSATCGTHGRKGG